MSAAVVGDEVEVVRKWSGEHLAVAKLVALGLSVELDKVDERLEDDQEDGWAVGIPLESYVPRWGLYTFRDLLGVTDADFES